MKLQPASFHVQLDLVAAEIGRDPTLREHGQIVGHEAPAVLWWALAVILVSGLTAARPEVSRPLSAGPGPAAGPQQTPAPALHPL